MSRFNRSLAALALCAPFLAAIPVSAKTKPTPAPGGALQRMSVTGCMNEFLFDGVWRLKVLSFEKGTYFGTAGYAVKLQLRNGTSKQLQVSKTGLGGEYGRNINLIMSDDSSVPVESVGSNTADYAAFTGASAPPGAAVNASLKFYPAQSVLDSADIKPKKLLIEIDPTAINPDYKHDHFRYPINDPSFRAKLDCDKGKS